MQILNLVSAVQEVICEVQAPRVHIRIAPLTWAHTCPLKALFVVSRSPTANNPVPPISFNYFCSVNVGILRTAVTFPLFRQQFSRAKQSIFRCVRCCKWKSSSGPSWTPDCLGAYTINEGSRYPVHIAMEAEVSTSCVMGINCLHRGQKCPAGAVCRALTYKWEK